VYFVLILAQQAQSLSLAPVAPVLFYLFAAVILISAWAVVFSQNLVRMSVYLLMTLAGAAAIYFMLDAEFLAAVQLIVYAGGTLILIIFGVMLTSKNPFMQLRTRPLEKLMGMAMGLLLAAGMTLAMLNTPLHDAGVVTGQSHSSQVGAYGHVELIGKGLLSEYLAPFEITAVLLLLVMVGAAFIARRRPQ
jgi:NADH-quinone oxidoreductase subunit J